MGGGAFGCACAPKAQARARCLARCQAPQPERPLTAAERVAALEAARISSEAAVLRTPSMRFDTEPARRAPVGKPLSVEEEHGVPAAPRHVDIRMYEGMATSRNRLSRRLVEVQKQNSVLRDALQDKDEALVDAFDCLSRAVCEYDNLCKLAQGAVAGVQFGVDQEDAMRKILLLQERMEFMHEKIMSARAALGGKVSRPVPVVWSGLASEVRLKGEFDDWGEGVLLSADLIDDHVFQRFRADVWLMPGRYRVKFLVDGEWRLAADWPTEDSLEGDTNNILVVEADT